MQHLFTLALVFLATATVCRTRPLLDPNFDPTPPPPPIENLTWFWQGQDGGVQVYWKWCSEVANTVVVPPDQAAKLKELHSFAEQSSDAQPLDVTDQSITSVDVTQHPLFFTFAVTLHAHRRVGRENTEDCQSAGVVHRRLPSHFTWIKFADVNDRSCEYIFEIYAEDNDHRRSPVVRQVLERFDDDNGDNKNDGGTPSSTEDHDFSVRPSEQTKTSALHM